MPLFGELPRLVLRVPSSGCGCLLQSRSRYASRGRRPAIPIDRDQSFQLMTTGFRRIATTDSGRSRPPVDGDDGRRWVIRETHGRPHYTGRRTESGHWGEAAATPRTREGRPRPEETFVRLTRMYNPAVRCIEKAFCINLGMPGPDCPGGFRGRSRGPPE